MNKSSIYKAIIYFADNLFWDLIIYIWYKQLLFQCVGSWTPFASKVLLWGILLASCLLGYIIKRMNDRDGNSIFLNLVIGYGTYTVLTYTQTNKIFIAVCISIALTISVIYALVLMCMKIEDGEEIRSVFYEKLCRIAFVVQKIFCVGFALIVVGLGVNTVFGPSGLKPSADVKVQSNLEEQSLANNIEEISQLEEDIWQDLSDQERLDVLQTVANVEQRYLGLPNELHVVACKLREGVGGYYSDTTHKIVVDLDELRNSSSWDVLNTICHEAYHSYQYRLVDVFNDSNSENQNLKMFRKISSYADEFDNYVSGDQSFNEYYCQNCERDARAYAEDAVDEYTARVYEYLIDKEYEEIFNDLEA